MKDELKRVIDTYLALSDSEENQKRCARWEPEGPTMPDLFRRTPRRYAETGCAPIVAPILPPLFAKLLHFSAREYFTIPEVYLLNYLKSMIALFDLGDDTVLEKTISFCPGVSFHPSFYGIETIYHEDDYPWLGRDPVLNEKSDLGALSFPDFSRSGLMPLVHRFYSEIGDIILDRGLRFSFPRVDRGPFGMAMTLRGFNNLAYDLMDDPDWVLELMRFLTDGHKKWHQDWCRFTGEPMPKAFLYEDEVSCDVISPEIYRRFVLPFHIEISRFQGGVDYWHSCGNITKILHLIKQVPGLRLLNISSWTDYAVAAQTCAQVPLELCIPAVGGVYLADEKKMRRDLSEMIAKCKSENVESFTIRLSGVAPFHGKPGLDLAKIRQWISVARDCQNQELP